MKEMTRISLDELPVNFARYFVRVVRARKAVVVEDKGNALAVLKPTTRAPRGKRRRKSAADYEAFLASAGAWKDLVDTEKLKKDIYESRKISSRPPIVL